MQRFQSALTGERDQAFQTNESGLETAQIEFWARFSESNSCKVSLIEYGGSWMYGPGSWRNSFELAL